MKSTQQLDAINEIGKILRAISNDETDEALLLKELCISVTNLHPGYSCCAYLYDHEEDQFVYTSRVSVGEPKDFPPGLSPRQNGWGMQAVRKKKTVTHSDVEGLSINPIAASAGLLERIVIPLMYKDHPLGVLYLDKWKELGYAVNYEAVQLLCQMVALGIWNNQKKNTSLSISEQTPDNITALRRATIQIASGMRFPEVCRIILENALSLTRAEYGIFRLLNDQRTLLIPQAMAGTERSQLASEELPIPGKSISAWVVEHGQVVCVGDLDQEPWKSRYIPLHKDLTMRSELAVPVYGFSGRLEGVINLESPVLHAFDEDDARLIQSLALHAMALLHETRLTDALMQINSSIISADLHDIQMTILSSIQELTGACAASVWSVDSNLIRLQACLPVAEETAYPLQNSLADMAISSKEPLWLDGDLLSLFRWQPDIPAAAQVCWAYRVIEKTSTLSGAVLCVYFSRNAQNAPQGNLWAIKILHLMADALRIAMINEQKQGLLAQAREKQAAAELFAQIGDVSTNILHQVNNRIGIIPARVQTIQTRHRELLSQQSALRKNLEEISRNAVEAMDVVRQNLDNLRPDLRRSVQLQSVIQDAANKSKIPETVKFEQDIQVGIPEIAVPSITLILVFQNLFENAVRAMQGKGSLRVKARLYHGAVVVDVIDNGPGIDPHKKESLFILDPSNLSHTTNLGFGLWWVRTQLLRMGGTIELLTRQSGAAFRITLPVASSGDNQ